MLRLYLTILLVPGLLAGCAVKDMVDRQFTRVGDLAMGEYFLERGKYDQGLAEFQKEVRKRPDDPSVNYYLGRFHLATDQPRKALTRFKKAVANAPAKADYWFWTGVAHSAVGNTQSERQCYEKALELNPSHVQALAYLGHNQLDRGQHRNALATYNRGLEKSPLHPQMLYNRALILRKLDRTPEEIEAWKVYLDHYWSGPFARRAARYLNEKGDFTYRNATIARRRVTLKSIAFVPLTAEIEKASRPTLDGIGDLVSADARTVLQVVAYQKKNAALAREKALAVKAYLLKHATGIAANRIKTSWFGQPESITVGEKGFKADASIRVFTTR